MEAKDGIQRAFPVLCLAPRPYLHELILSDSAGPRQPLVNDGIHFATD